MSFTLALTQYDPKLSVNKTLVLALDLPEAIHGPFPGEKHPDEWVARSTDKQYQLWGKWYPISNSRRIEGAAGGLGNMSGKNPVAYKWKSDTKELVFVELVGGTTITITARLDGAWVHPTSRVITHKGKTNSDGKGLIFEPGRSLLFDPAYDHGEISWRGTTQVK